MSMGSVSLERMTHHYKKKMKILSMWKNLQNIFLIKKKKAR